MTLGASEEGDCFLPTGGEAIRAEACEMFVETRREELLLSGREQGAFEVVSKFLLNCLPSQRPPRLRPVELPLRRSSRLLKRGPILLDKMGVLQKLVNRGFCLKALRSSLQVKSKWGANPSTQEKRPSTEASRQACRRSEFQGRRSNRSILGESREQPWRE